MGIPRDRNPKWRIHSGEILREQFMEPMKLSANRLARELHISPPTINDIVRRRRGISADTAVLLARYFDTSEQFWLNLQCAYDVSRAKSALRNKLKKITPAAKHAIA